MAGKTEKPICKLTNGQFSWIMSVDGQEISFDGFYNAEYFAKHYRKLGYKVEWIDVERLNIVQGHIEKNEQTAKKS